MKNESDVTIISDGNGLRINDALNGLEVISQLDVDGFNQLARNCDDLEDLLFKFNINAIQPKYLVEKEAAAYLRTSRARVFTLRKNGELKHISFGNRNVYRVEDLDAYMEEASKLWTI